MKIDDFIEVYDNVLTAEECATIIAYFEHMKKLNLVFNRQDNEKTFKHEKEDETCFLLAPHSIFLDYAHPILHTVLEKFGNCYRNYLEKYSILQKPASSISSMRLQKTKPGGGYHIWHHEQSNRINCVRIITFMIYLNTVSDGGETEFLYQNTRVNPVEGRIVIWPAGFTHTHRGNQPIGSEKYAITGWVNLNE